MNAIIIWLAPWRAARLLRQQHEQIRVLAQLIAELAEEVAEELGHPAPPRPRLYRVK